VAAIFGRCFPLFVFDGDIFHVYSLEQQKFTWKLYTQIEVVFPCKALTWQQQPEIIIGHSIYAARMMHAQSAPTQRLRFNRGVIIRHNNSMAWIRLLQSTLSIGFENRRVTNAVCCSPAISASETDSTYCIETRLYSISPSAISVRSNKPSPNRFARIRQTGFRFVKLIARSRKILYRFRFDLANRLPFHALNVRLLINHFNYLCCSAYLVVFTSITGVGLWSRY